MVWLILSLVCQYLQIEVGSMIQAVSPVQAGGPSHVEWNLRISMVSDEAVPASSSLNSEATVGRHTTRNRQLASVGRLEMTWPACADACTLPGSSNQMIVIKTVYSNRSLVSKTSQFVSRRRGPNHCTDRSRGLLLGNIWYSLITKM